MDYEETYYFDACSDNETMDPLQLEETLVADYEDDKIVVNETEQDRTEENEKPRLRKSLSVGNIFYLENAVEQFKVNDATMTDNHYFPVYKSRFTKNYMSSENLDRLACSKRFTSQVSLNGEEYVPLAEAVKKFPNYLHSRSLDKENKPIKLTIPQSPCLISNKRTRPVYAISREEEERQQFEEAQKNKFKAHGVNKKIFEEPKKLTVEKKCTIPEPFHLTEFKSKPVKQEEVPVFHAKRAPDFSRHPPALKVPLTKPLAKTEKVEKVKERNAANNKKPTLTKAVPFSFEERNKMLESKKEEFIKKVLEEEKKAREFHAKPIPKGLLKSSNNNSSSSSSKSCEDTTSFVPPFKAKTPTVLYKEPFKPQVSSAPLTRPQEFNLHTDQRIKGWEKFQEHLQEIEERNELYKERMEMKKQQQEEEEIKRLREMTKYVAQPIKKYKPVEIKPANKVTEPVSPNFAYKKRNKNL